MRTNAFSAGVIPGGLKDKNEIKILICYLINAVKAPLKKSDITLVLQAYGLANYFEVSEAFSEMESNGSIRETGEGFGLTAEGKMIVEELLKNLPSAVRDKALRAMNSYVERIKIEKENKVTIKETNNGFEVNCTVSDGEFDMMKLSLYAPDREFADVIKNNFHKNPGNIYRSVLSLFVSEGFHEDFDK